MIRCWVSTTRLHRGDKTDPPIVVSRDGTESYAASVELHGTARIVYDPDGLHNGVRVWVEADDCTTHTDVGHCGVDT